MPVYGFFAAGAGALADVELAAGVVGAAEVLFVLELPLHAALASSAVAARDAAIAWRARIMVDPLP
jgi:uncharacterized membrane protein